MNSKSPLPSSGERQKKKKLILRGYENWTRPAIGVSKNDKNEKDEKLLGASI